MRWLKENLFAKVEHISDFGEALASYEIINLAAIRQKLSPAVPAVNLGTRPLLPRSGQYRSVIQYRVAEPLECGGDLTLPVLPRRWLGT
jgi:hypothetical protein